MQLDVDVKLMQLDVDLRPRYLVCRFTITLARLGLYVKVLGQRSRSMTKILFWHHCYLGLRSRSKARVNVKGQTQIQKVRVNLLTCSGRY